MTWTFITVTYNSEKPLQEFWEAGHPYGVEWIVVDNNSTDATVKIATELGAKVLRLDSNMGFSKANNLGLEVSTGDYICFANPDVTVDWSTLDGLQRAIDDLGGIVSPQLVNKDGSIQPNGRGIPYLAHKILTRLGLKGPWVPDYFPNTTESYATPVWWVIGAAVCGSKKLFEILGGWDEKFFLYYEDSDICLRARENGAGTFVIGDYKWIHGWARATKSLNFNAWKRELPSMVTFYGRYPRLIFGLKIRSSQPDTRKN